MSTEIAPVDARVLRTRETVIAAMRTLFEEEGPAGITHQRVAKRARVTRATLYRHWPRPIDLVIEAIASAEQPILRSGSGPLREWLRRELRRTADNISRAESMQFVGTLILMGDSDPGIGALRDELMAGTERVLSQAFDEAVAAGELSRKPDPADAAAQIVGALVFRLQVQRRPADEEFIEHVIDGALVVGAPHGLR